MDKKYQIFISSTYKDLKTARKRVSETILSMGHFPVGMEMFGARNEEQWTVITDTIDQSDYYIIIMGRCFGSQVPGEEISYTQKEFRYAKDKGLPILAFIVSDDAELPKTFQDTNPDKIAKLKQFRSELETGRTVDYWKNYDHLATEVAVSLPKAFTSHPMPGWLRVKKDDYTREPDDKMNKCVEHYIAIKQVLEKELVDYNWVKSSSDRIELARKPWRKFNCNNLILRNDAIHNPSFENGLIKVEPYDFYDDGILVSSSIGSGTIKIRVTSDDNNPIVTSAKVDIVEAVPFNNIIAFDKYGSKNYPYPTLHCLFQDGNPYDEEWYIDQATGIRYSESQIVSKEWM